MISIPTLRRALAASIATLAIAGLAAGCGGGDKKKKKAESFPPSVTAPQSKSASSTLDPKVVPEPDPDIGHGEPVVEPVVEPEITPTTYSGFIAAGKNKFAAGDSAAALEMFTRANELKDYAFPKIQMARALLQMGEHDQARVHVEKAIDMDGTSSFAWNTLGRVELSAGNSEAAVTSFEHAVDNDETNSYAWNNLGFALINLERWSEASEALEHATSSAAPRPYMYNNLAIAYEHLDMLDEARAAYRSASEMGSERAAASLIRLEGVKTIKIPEADVDKSDDSDALQVDPEVDAGETGLIDGLQRGSWGSGPQDDAIIVGC
jgi:Flp pilus assembly protein TadD